ncbi:MAG: hypothetical protein JWO50_776 [Candidatus Kaiserbacteria bacterium]|nr:hypothetical protein [Candidatus Kaiserbacteria bacterium]
MYRIFVYIVPALALLVPVAASAHEVYILSSSTIAQDVGMVSPNPIDAFYTNQGRFFLWGFIAFVTVSTIFCMSIFRVFEAWTNPFLYKLKRYAPLVERVTLGLTLIAFAYNSALFGPELPLVGIYGAYTPWVVGVLYVSGVLITLGLFTRIAAFLVALITLVSIPVHGWYMCTYTAYFVVTIVICIMGGGAYSLDRLLGRGKKKNTINQLRKRFEPYEMLALRIGFGISVIAAAIFAKFLHTDLALDVIRIYHLTNYFQFEPLFIVLGALIIEILIGLFIMFGIEIRWTALFFLFWLILSLLYFGEGVWPHLALFGLNFMLFFHGYDRYTIEGRFFKKHPYEPVF